MLQNGVAGETQNPVNGTEDLAASRVDVTSAVESPASLPGVPMSLQGIHHYRASILTHLLELLEMLRIAKDHSATSCHQDIVENLPSAALTQAGSSDDDSKQDDSSSLLPEVNGNVGADVPQQSLIDAHDISDEAASVPVNTSCHRLGTMIPAVCYLKSTAMWVPMCHSDISDEAASVPVNTSCQTARHNDSSSLLPEVNGNVGADVPQ